MPYVSTMEIFQDGLKQGYGTPMFNCINYEMIRWATTSWEPLWISTRRRRKSACPC